MGLRVVSFHGKYRDVCARTVRYKRFIKALGLAETKTGCCSAREGVVLECHLANANPNSPPVMGITDFTLSLNGLVGTPKLCKGQWDLLFQSETGGRKFSGA